MQDITGKKTLTKERDVMKTRKLIAFLIVCVVMFTSVTQAFAQVFVNIEYLSFNGNNATVYATIGSDQAGELNNGDAVTFKVYADEGLLTTSTVNVVSSVYSVADSVYYYNDSDSALAGLTFDTNGKLKSTKNFKVVASAVSRLTSTTNESSASFVNPNYEAPISTIGSTYSPVKEEKPAVTQSATPVTAAPDVVISISQKDLKIDQKTKSVEAEVSSKAFEDALKGAKTGDDGKVTVQLVIPKVEDAKAYQTQLPANILNDTNASKVVEINTGMGAIVVPSNMLSTTDTKENAKVELSIAAADTSKVSDEVKAKIGNRPVIELSVAVDNKTIEWSNPEAPVTISMPYSPSVEELKNPDSIVIWYIDGSGKAVSVPTGKYDPATKAVTFTTTHFSKYAVTYVTKTFTDIAKSPYKKKIEAIAAKGITTSVNTFAPTRQLTRAEFVVLLVRALGLTAKADSNFSDVKTTDYYYNAIGIAKKLGIVQGGSKDKCNPNGYLSRQDMMVMIARALKAANKMPSTAPESILSKYSDAATISNYAKESIAALVKDGIVSVSKNLRPMALATREEAADIIYNAYKK